MRFLSLGMFITLKCIFPYVPSSRLVILVIGAMVMICNCTLHKQGTIYMQTHLSIMELKCLKQLLINKIKEKQKDLEEVAPFDSLIMNFIEGLQD